MKITPFSLHNEKLTYLFQYSQLISTKRAILFELLFFKSSISTVNEIILTIRQGISTSLTNTDIFTANYLLSYYAIFKTLIPFMIFQMK
ncbi:hypothetical protein COC45_04255 [Bacillus cereus]|nr:hypothetical protein COJ40_13935 [Bacillus cereus]PGS15153.1 hypothetical protein COC45_04255 [Bacillus cereus]